MTRIPVLKCLVLVCGIVAPVSADDWQLHRSITVTEQQSEQTGPALRSQFEGESWTGLYSGFKAATGLATDHETEVDLYFGIRPTVLGFDMDLNYNHKFQDFDGSCCGILALNFNRPLWSFGSLTGRFSLSPEADRAFSETRAQFEILENVELESRIRAEFEGMDSSKTTIVRYGFAAARRFEHLDGSETHIGIRFADQHRSPANTALTVRYEVDF
ncbi:MAG: hypothetical protein AAGG56_15260 [Pseudomonadota bacterium]